MPAYLQALQKTTPRTATSVLLNLGGETGRRTSGGLIGALVGGSVGTLIGALAGGRVGILIGALAGGRVGNGVISFIGGRAVVLKTEEMKQQSAMRVSKTLLPMKPIFIFLCVCLCVSLG